MVRDALPSKLVVGVDGSAAADAAVRWALREATMRRLPIELLNVVAPSLISSTMAPNDTITQGQEDRAREIFGRARRILDELSADNPPNVDYQLAYAAVVPALVDASKNAQMVVVGRRGPEAFGRHMLG